MMHHSPREASTLKGRLVSHQSIKCVLCECLDLYLTTERYTGSERTGRGWPVSSSAVAILLAAAGQIREQDELMGLSGRQA